LSIEQERRPGDEIDPFTEKNGPPSDQKGEVCDQNDPFIEQEREASDQDGEVVKPIEEFNEANGSSVSRGVSSE
jgi:hypothetical protein